mmetsp:Transcript_25635/g.32660  ORF Transcript_25635/g.32660 Transcript_25635/m.32660 type:complete len:184 (+) Transcript_25635:174-725(+)
MPSHHQVTLSQALDIKPTISTKVKSRKKRHRISYRIHVVHLHRSRRRRTSVRLSLLFRERYCILQQKALLAMMKFGKKIRSIDSKKKENKKTGTGAGISLTNRVNDLNSAKERVMNLSDKCGYPTNTEQKLTSSDIQLDMSSSMDLVELRDALVQVEILEVDPILEMTEKSHLWWKERDRKNE